MNRWSPQFRKAKKTPKREWVAWAVFYVIIATWAASVFETAALFGRVERLEELQGAMLGCLRMGGHKWTTYDDSSLAGECLPEAPPVEQHIHTGPNAVPVSL